MSPTLTQQAQSEFAKSALLLALSDPAVASIDFRLASVLVHPKLYRKVYDRVARGDIAVWYDAKLGGIAIYDSARKQIELGFVTARNMGERALIIHECTHAAFDVEALDVDTVTDEAAGYVAGWIFQIAHMHRLQQIDPDRTRLTPDGFESPLAFAAAAVAFAFYKASLGRRASPAEQRQLEARLRELEQEIGRHAVYARKVRDDALAQRLPGGLPDPKYTGVSRREPTRAVRRVPMRLTHYRVKR